MHILIIDEVVGKNHICENGCFGLEEESYMQSEVIEGILIPFLGTALGASCVFFMKSMLKVSLQRILNGFAAGVMVAASIWSLLLAAMEQAAGMGRLAFVPAVIGFWIGIAFLMVLESEVHRLYQKREESKCSQAAAKGTTMMVLAVTLHNIPEGMAVGAVFAGCLSGSSEISMAEALALSIGIAIQNFPEGAIISMPLKADGMRKKKAFACGVLSGVVEPVAAVFTVLASGIIVPVLPYLLSFAAGAMIYVVVEELIPEMSQGKHSKAGTVLFAVGFTLMMALDVALG